MKLWVLNGVQSKGYGSQSRSRRRVVIEEKKEAAYQMALWASSENSFVVVTRLSYVKSGCCVIVPCEWARNHKFHKNLQGELHIDGKRWPVNYVCGKRGYTLSAGWKKFVNENSVKEFDVFV